jgi:hypothetical protein
MILSTRDRFVQSPTTTPATRVFFDNKLKNVSLEPLSVMRLQTAAAGSVARAVAEMGTPKPATDKESVASESVGDTHATTAAALVDVAERIKAKSAPTKIDVSDGIAVSTVKSRAENRSTDAPHVNDGPVFDIEEAKLAHGLYDESLDSLEVCPLAYATVEEVANNVKEYGGAALFIDYGENFPQVGEYPYALM